MKRDTIKFISLTVLLMAFVAVISFVLSLRPQGNSLESDLKSLEERLEQLGIPVKSIVVTEPSPLEIKVVLISSGTQENLNQDDLWNKLLTEREIEIANLNYAMNIVSYRLMLENASGKSIYDSTVFIYPDLPSQNIAQTSPSSVGNIETEKILRDNLDLHGLKLLTLEAPTSFITNDNGKLVTLTLATETSADQIDSAQINEFIISLRPQIEKINSEFGTHIVLIRVQIRDSAQSSLLDYMLDLQTGRESSWTAENIDGSWYSQPASPVNPEPGETSVPQRTPTTAPPESTGIPTPTLPSGAYPPPPPTPLPYP